MSSTLDPHLVAGVLKKNLANILDKVKAGKTLSKQERELFESHAKTEAPESVQADNVGDLAKRLGVSRPTVYAWRKKYQAEVPSDLDVSKWRIFAAAISSKTGSVGSELGSLAHRKAKAEAEKSELAVIKLRMEIDVLQGRMMSREDQQAEGEAVGVIIQAAFTSLGKDLDSNLVGKSPEERRATIRRLCNEKLANVIERLGSL